MYTEPQYLDYKNDWRPLVVCDLPVPWFMRLQHILVERHIVSVRHPAVDVSIPTRVSGGGVSRLDVTEFGLLPVTRVLTYWVSRWSELLG